MEYKFHRSQMGFQPKKGTERAILRHRIATRQGREYAAVLDLKSAYDKVNRDKLLMEVERRISFNVTAMVSHSLTRTTFTVQGDEAGTRGASNLGVPQGSPISPTLFNIFMDTLAEGICELQFSDWGQESGRLTMFADDVILLARNDTELHSMLHKCTEWAAVTGMVWSTSKCSILTRNKSLGPFRLAGDTLAVQSKTTYLGVTIDSGGVAEDMTVERLSRAKKRIQMISTLGMFRGGISTEKSIKIFKTLSGPCGNIRVHLTPHTSTNKKRI